MMVQENLLEGNDRFPYLCTIHNCRGSDFLCYGVLVNPQLVVTASYCFNDLGRDFETHDLVVQCGNRHADLTDTVHFLVLAMFGLIQGCIRGHVSRILHSTLSNLAAVVSMTSHSFG